MVEFGPRPKICVAIFFTKFRVDANSYYLLDTNNIKSEICDLLELHMMLRKKEWSFGIDSRIDAALLTATAKTTFTKTLITEKKKGVSI